MNKYLDPTLKLIILIINIIFVFFISDIRLLVLMLVFALILALLTKTNLLKSIKVLSYALFLSVFTFIIVYSTTGEYSTSLFEALRVIIIFTIIFVFSMIYKASTSNKEMSYGISNLLRIFTPLGYNQNKMYTTFLLILNSIFSMYGQVKNMYFYERRMYPKKISIIKKTKIVIDLVAPFFSKLMFKNDVASMALVTKDFDLNNKSIKIYKTDKTSIYTLIFIFTYELVSIGSILILSYN